MLGCFRRRPPGIARRSGTGRPMFRWSYDSARARVQDSMASARRSRCLAALLAVILAASVPATVRILASNTSGCLVRGSSDVVLCCWRHHNVVQNCTGVAKESPPVPTLHTVKAFTQLSIVHAAVSSATANVIAVCAGSKCHNRLPQHRSQPAVQRTVCATSSRTASCKRFRPPAGTAAPGSRADGCRRLA